MSRRKGGEPGDEIPPGGGNGNAPDTDAEEATGLTGVSDSAPAPAPTPELMAALRAERDELKDQLLRRRADFENYKRRVERDRELACDERAAQIFGALIPAIDNLERALGASGDEATLRAGVELIRRELVALLEKHGVRAHDPTGQVFDPAAHQALIHEEVSGFEEGTVAEAFRKGYSYKERLLRPALVKVAKGGAASGPEPDEGKD